MKKNQYMVVGINHIDLAWKKDRREMAELLDIMVIRLLDTLDHNPDFKYVLEQAYHYRALAERRPDLIERLKHYLKLGRLEMVGGMASTLETNIPNGECFVKNQMIGMKWVKENFDVNIKTGWLIDTFGTNAQVPQILNHFGIKHLMANRFGGSNIHDIFISKGLDGSEILIVGWHSNSSYIKPVNLTKVDCKSWSDVDNLFKKADELTGDGPFIVIPFIENEMTLGLHQIELVKQRNFERADSEWLFASPKDYFNALEETTRSWPIEKGDLNPEYTGTFSLRTMIRVKNRKVETLLLEAEKWAVLTGLKGFEKKLEGAWWEMSYAQFHDVFTGSHPTNIYSELMKTYESIEHIALEILNSSFNILGDKHSQASGKMTLRVFNGLPWERKDVVTIPLNAAYRGVSIVKCGMENIPFEVKDNNLSFIAQIPAVGFNEFSIENGQNDKLINQEMTSSIIENEYMLLECDKIYGIKRLVLKETNEVLIENAGDFLIVQQDDGHFQIEAPAGGEVAASAGELKVYQTEPSEIRQSVIVSGKFPALAWAGENNQLTFSAEFSLFKDKPRLDLKLRLNWKGEASRIRLKLSTLLDTSSGIYEIPFGTAIRKPYGIKKTAKGEWPAHRFVAMEDKSRGIALVNTGTVGVEVTAGTLITTLLRAPKSIWDGVPVDASSSQHGAHEYTFAVVPYAGSWHKAGVAAMAQEVNNPLNPSVCQGCFSEAAPLSYLNIDKDNIVLSTVKAPQDGNDELILRVYETAGKQTHGKLHVRGANTAWKSDLREHRYDIIPCEDGTMDLFMNPFEIKTLRISKERT